MLTSIPPLQTYRVTSNHAGPLYPVCELVSASGASGKRHARGSAPRQQSTKAKRARVLREDIVVGVNPQADSVGPQVSKSIAHSACFPRVGMVCMAKWEDGRYYPADITAVDKQGKVSVYFIDDSTVREEIEQHNIKQPSMHTRLLSQQDLVGLRFIEGGRSWTIGEFEPDRNNYVCSCEGRRSKEFDRAYVYSLVRKTL